MVEDMLNLQKIFQREILFFMLNLVKFFILLIFLLTAMQNLQSYRQTVISLFIR